MTEDRIAKATIALNSLDYLWKSDLNRRHKIRQLNARVFPVLLYGCETWSMKREG